MERRAADHLADGWVVARRQDTVQSFLVDASAGRPAADLSVNRKVWPGRNRWRLSTALLTNRSAAMVAHHRGFAEARGGVIIRRDADPDGVLGSLSH